jgi:hypothetical protein
MAFWCLLLFLALCSSAQCATPTETSVVSTSGQLRQALLAPGVSTVVLSRQLLLDPQQFEPLAVARPVTITSITGHAMLNFGSAMQPLINVAAGGALSLHGLTLAGFYPAEPLAYTTATSMMPLSAVGINSTGAMLSVSSSTLLVDGPATKLTATMPFWQVAAQQGSLAGPSSRGPQQQQEAAVTASDGSAAVATTAERTLVGSRATVQQQVLELPLLQRSYYGGNSSVSLQDSIVALDPNGCYDGSSALAWSSQSLLAALQGGSPAATGSSSSNVLVFTDIVLDPFHFTQLRSAPIPSVNVSGCSSSPASLNFNRIARAVTLQQGARMVLGGGLRLLQAAPLEDRSRASNNSAALLLLGSVDVSAGAELLLQNVVVTVPDSSSVEQAMQAVAKQQEASSSTPSVQELSAAEAAAVAVPDGDGPALLVNSWSVRLTGLELHGGAAAAAPGKALRFHLVMQHQQPQQMEVAADGGQQQQQQQQHCTAAADMWWCEVFIRTTQRCYTSTHACQPHIALQSVCRNGMECAAVPPPCG